VSLRCNPVCYISHTQAYLIDIRTCRRSCCRHLEITGGLAARTLPYGADHCWHLGCRLEALHQASSEALHSVRMPTRHTEEFRFTDLALITQSQLQVPPGLPPCACAQQRVGSDRLLLPLSPAIGCPCCIRSAPA